METARGDNGENSTENSSRQISNFPQICCGLSVERLSSSQPLRCRDLTGYHGDKGGVYAVEFSDDGSLFASGGYDDRVLLWSTSKSVDEKCTPNPTAMETKHDSAIWCLAMSPDNERLFSGGLDGKLLVHSTNTFFLFQFHLSLTSCFHSFRIQIHQVRVIEFI